MQINHYSTINIQFDQMLPPLANNTVLLENMSYIFNIIYISYDKYVIFIKCNSHI